MLESDSYLEHVFVERAAASGLTENQYFAKLLAAGSPPSTEPDTVNDGNRVERLLIKWNTELGTPPPPRGHRTLAELSAIWAAEDANLTDEEREADRLFYEERERDYDSRETRICLSERDFAAFVEAINSAPKPLTPGLLAAIADRDLRHSISTERGE